jgi:hypothetical protein
VVTIDKSLAAVEPAARRSLVTGATAGLVRKPMPNTLLPKPLKQSRCRTQSIFRRRPHCWWPDGLLADPRRRDPEGKAIFVESAAGGGMQVAQRLRPRGARFVVGSFNSEEKREYARRSGVDSTHPASSWVTDHRQRWRRPFGADDLRMSKMR